MNSCLREARDENGIRKTKAVIQKLKKASSWYVGKLLKMHKNAGFEAVRDAYKKTQSRKRDWYRGYVTFQSVADISQRFKSAKPLSCFLIGNDATRLCVSFKPHDRVYQDEESEDDLFYVTLTCKPSTMHIKETGVHFCRFEMDGVVHSAKKEEVNISNYALMLPYIQKERQGIPFQMQYTLIYSDWEVLRCDLPSEPKGLSSSDNRLFNEMI
jgi:hypothetical protein